MGCVPECVSPPVWSLGARQCAHPCSCERPRGGTLPVVVRPRMSFPAFPRLEEATPLTLSSRPDLQSALVPLFLSRSTSTPEQSLGSSSEEVPVHGLAQATACVDSSVPLSHSAFSTAPWSEGPLETVL